MRGHLSVWMCKAFLLLCRCKEKVVAKGRSETDEEEVDAASDSSFSMAECGRNLGYVTD